MNFNREPSKLLVLVGGQDIPTEFRCPPFHPRSLLQGSGHDLSAPGPMGPWLRKLTRRLWGGRPLRWNCLIPRSKIPCHGLGSSSISRAQSDLTPFNVDRLKQLSRCQAGKHKTSAAFGRTGRKGQMSAVCFSEGSIAKLQTNSC